MVKSNKRKLTREDLPSGIVYPFDKDYEDGIEIIYHRKDWGWRNSIMNYFGWRTLEPDQYRFEIDEPSSILSLIEMTAHWLDKETWENDGDSIWSYDEIRPVLIKDIANFALIYGFMLENRDVYLEFYDSY